MNYIFDLEHIAVILDFTSNTMSRVFPGLITVSGVPKNPKIDTKFINLRKFCLKLYKWKIWPWTNSGHLGFTHNAMSRVSSCVTTASGLPKNTIIDTKIMNLRPLWMSKTTSIRWLTSAKWRPSWKKWRLPLLSFHFETAIILSVMSMDISIKWYHISHLE